MISTEVFIQFVVLLLLPKKGFLLQGLRRCLTFEIDFSRVHAPLLTLHIGLASLNSELLSFAFTFLPFLPHLLCA